MPAIKTRSDTKRRRRAAGARAQQHQWLAANLDKSTLALGQGMDLKEYTSNAARFGFKLLTTGDKNAQGLAQLVGGYGDGMNTQKTGTFYAMANLTDTPNTSTQHAYVDRRSDMEKLRAGEKLSDKASRVLFTIKIKNSKNEYEATNIIVHLQARDADHGVFFGDRPLDNPGYSAIKLMAGGVGANQKNAAIDVVRVEQRLKYLGFTGYEKTHDQKIKEFTVDGIWGATEESSLRGFYAATHYTSYGKGKGYEGSDTAEGKTVVDTTDSLSNGNFNWLNAYNAPHLVNAYQALPVPFPTTNTPTNRFANGAGTKEPYTTSWVYDLMQRWRVVQNSLSVLSDAEKAKVLFSDHIKVNGMTLPPGYDNTAPYQHETGGHSTAMALDLGIVGNNNSFVRKFHSQDNSNNNQSLPAMTGTNGWDYQKALDWSGLISNTTNPGEQVALRNFLSLYSLTVADGDKTNKNGSWEEWRLVNGDAAKEALFGDGTQAKSMIQHVYVGDGPTSAKDKNGKTISVPANYNSYPLIIGVLKKLNVDAGNSDAHEHHFHIDFRTPGRVAIATPPKQLMTNIESERVSHVPPDWVEQSRQDFEHEIGEAAMVTYDVAALPDAQVMLVAQGSQASTKERVLGICMPVGYIAPVNPNGGVNGLSPDTAAVSYLRRHESRTLAESEYPDTVRDIQVVRQPMHGRVNYETVAGQKEVFWQYVPQTGYEGKDRVDFVVQVKGQPVRLVYLLEVTKKNIDTTPGEEFCKRASWKISQSTPDSSTPTPWLQSAQLSALLSAASTLPVSFAPLPASTLGQTLGVGEGAQITLDDNAAGHGWYIDPTPLDNSDDYLPTSDPRLWQAKPGSAAEGKMDLLSVLLHEVGHALGEEHSQHAGDYMATSLQSGQRKLPSAQEIEHLLALSAALHPSKQPLPHVPHGFTAITSIASVEPPVSTTLCGGLGGTGLTS